MILCESNLQLAVPENKQDEIDLTPGNLTIRLEHTLHRFHVKKFWIQTGTNNVKMAFQLERLTQSFWISVFIPSGCLILAAEMTLFIDEVHFEATIMVALTANLVIYTLYNAIQEDLPVDSSLKLIDVWLLHGLLMPMVVFVILVVNKLIKATGESHPPNLKLGRKKNFNDKKGQTRSKEIVITERLTFMSICKIIVPTTSVIFMITFFGVGISHQMSNQG